MYGLLGLAAAALALHKGLGLKPSTTEDGTNWSTFSTQELYYLDAIVRKAKGTPPQPPTNGIKCVVCGYSTGVAGDMTACPVGCPIVPVDFSRDDDPVYCDD